jgi:hypothetical protein
MDKQARENNKTVDNPPVAEQLLFDLSEATPFKAGLFDGSTVCDPEIDLLTVKAINRSTKNTDTLDKDELEIEHGMMILNSHRKELAELAELEEATLSNKKVAVVMIMLMFFVIFVAMIFLVSKLMSDAPGADENDSGITRNYP